MQRTGFLPTIRYQDSTTQQLDGMISDRIAWDDTNGSLCCMSCTSHCCTRTVAHTRQTTDLRKELDIKVISPLPSCPSYHCIRSSSLVCLKVPKATVLRRLLNLTRFKLPPIHASLSIFVAIRSETPRTSSTLFASHTIATGFDTCVSLVTACCGVVFFVAGD